MQTIKCEVGEHYDEDGGRSIARLDKEALGNLGLSQGDIVRISGESEAFAKVWRSDRSDWYEEKILLDEIIRYNAQAELGDEVTIEKVTLDAIEQITLLPCRGDNFKFEEDGIEYLKQQQLEKPVQIGTVLGFHVADSGKQIPLVVTGNCTINPGIITESTTIEIPDNFLSTTDSE